MTQDTWSPIHDSVLEFLAIRFQSGELPYGSARELHARAAGTLTEKREHLRMLVAGLYVYPVGEKHYRLSIRGLLMNARGSAERHFVDRIMNHLVSKEISSPGYDNVGWEEFAARCLEFGELLDDGPRYVYGILQMMNVTEGGFPNNPGPWSLRHEMLEQILEARSTERVLDLFSQAASRVAERSASTEPEMASGQDSAGGSNSRVDLQSLHPRIIKAVAPLWRLETLATAVEQASKLVSRAAQDYSGRIDDGGVSMLHELLKPSPPDAKSGRLLLGSLDTQSDRDRQDGLRNLAVGAQLAIRNVATHGNLGVQSFADAYEQLCIISWILRQLDKTTLVPFEPSEDDDGK